MAGEVSRHSILRAGNMKMVQERERIIAAILRGRGATDLSDTRVFEAGCSTGYNVRMFVQWGAKPENVAGMDINAEATKYISEQSPRIRTHTGSAEAVPEPDDSFDISLAFTLFSSVPDEETSSAIASETMRVTRPGGLIIVYDMRRRSPRNPAVHAVRRADVRRWFPGCGVRTRSLTVAPPFARRLPRLYGLFAAIPPLRTHLLHVIDTPNA